MTSIFGCQHKPKLLYQNNDYTIYSDKVIQGNYVAQVLPDGSMTSNYESSSNEPQKRKIELKFSINQKDNELPFATNHQLIIKPQDGSYTSPLITFGEQYIDSKDGAEQVLEQNLLTTIRLDMNPVFNSFKEKGFYTDLNGDKIYKDDFKGVFMAGNITPLNFDFENLGENVQLKDPDGDHIYEISLNINTYDPDRYVKPEWKLTEDISKYPQLKTDNALLQSLYNMALEETVLLSEKDGTFRTGAKWAGVWTRDISYSILLGMGIADVERSKTSLLKKVKRNRIIQDTGSGGAWPVSSDRTTWALAAWEIYLITGEEVWLDYCYQVISNTIEDDRKVVYDSSTGLYRGESSFLDWRVQTYPAWMDNVDIYSSINLGTNIVHYRTLRIISEISTLTGQVKQAKKYAEWAEELKVAINKHFWNEEKGYYIQFTYGRNFNYNSPKSEALGEAFSVLFDVAPEDRANSVIKNTPVVSWGVPCVYPQIPDIRPYHNNGIWPFVQAYWNLAAAKTGNIHALNHGLSALYRASAMFLTNKENMVAENGDFITALNSDRQLWSVAGNLGMIYKVFFGISLSPDSIHFNPVIPKNYAGKMELSNLKIRNKEFSIKIKGYGNKIASIKVDGKTVQSNQLPLLGEDKHIIEINMANNAPESDFNLVDNKFHLATPQLQTENGILKWTPVEGAEKYEVFRNGKLLTSTIETTYKPDLDGEYCVKAIDTDNTPSFVSEPYSVFKNIKEVILKQYAEDKRISFATSPKGFIEVSKNKNLVIKWKANIKESGTYKLYFEYTNGNGPWNTDNKCAIRTLWVNGKKVSPVVLAQRGLNEWASIGNSNIINIDLQKGDNSFKLSFEPENENMNVDNNTALIGNMILIKM